MSVEGSFFGYLCAHGVLLIGLHALLWVGLLFNTLAYLAIEQRAATTVIIGLNYVGLVVLLVGSGVIILLCRRRSVR